MVCWPVHIVGIFFISIIVIDTLQYSWKVIPYHAALGVFFTGLYYVFCTLFGESISLAVLFVPALFILTFFLTTWLFYNKLTAQHCCMTCNEEGTSENTNTNTKPIFLDFWNWIVTDTNPKKPKCPPPS